MLEFHENSHINVFSNPAECRQTERQTDKRAGENRSVPSAKMQIMGDLVSKCSEQSAAFGARVYHFSL